MEMHGLSALAKTSAVFAKSIASSSELPMSINLVLMSKENL